MNYPKENCSKETVIRISDASQKLFNALDHSIYARSNLVCKIISLYAKSMDYAPEEKRNAMRAEIVRLSKKLIKQNIISITHYSLFQDLANILFLKFACKYSNTPEKELLENQFITSFFNIVKNEKNVTANYGKEIELWEFGRLLFNSSSDYFLKSCIAHVREAGISDSKIARLKSDVAQLFAETTKNTSKGDYFVLLERTFNTISWLSETSEKNLQINDMLARIYLDESNDVRDKKVLVSAFLLRIAMSFNCSSEMKDEINAKFLEIKPILSALKLNSHSWSGNGFTLTGKLAGILAENYGEPFNQPEYLANLLLKYDSDPIHLVNIEYADL